ncbi:MAG: FkbM family methyltransferase [Magnetococcales bacterium]|nr:FkbM family methyltransferase [Magnetococcales bacterium]
MSAWMEGLRLWHRAWRYRLGRDHNEIRFLLDHLQPGQTAVDVGAHKGAYTHWMRHAVGEGGRVIAFEPQPLLAARLEQLFPQPGTVTVERLALSARGGTSRLLLPGAGDSSPGARLMDDGETEEAGRVVGEIALTTLDDYLLPRKLAPALLKIDVEGREMEVLQGGTGLLSSARPHILLECEARHQRGHAMADVFAVLRELGYEGGFFLQDRPQPLSAFRPEMQGADFHAKGYINNFFFSPSGG